jgi:hypothetical protein
MKDFTKWIFLPVLIFGKLFAQDYSAGDALPLFQSHEIIHFTLKSDLSALLADVDDDRKQHPATLEYIKNGDTIRLDLQVRTRGNFRRNSDNCSFPPLRFNFKKKQVRGTFFSGVDKIKLVTHCMSNQRRHQHYVLKEYLIYRVLNLLTDTSFRVRPVKIIYEDASKQMKTQESYAFFIEPDEAFEERFNARQSEQKYLFPDSTNYHHAGLVSFFQYMVGNTDWAVTTLHNVRLFEIYPDQPPHIVPYDFDWTGAVNAHYAVPLPHLGSQSVVERIYRGQCRPLEEFLALADFYNTKQQEIIELYDSFDLLPKRERRQSIRYINDFYKIINSERMINTEILGSCIRTDKLFEQIPTDH